MARTTAAAGHSSPPVQRREPVHHTDRPKVRGLSRPVGRVNSGSWAEAADCPRARRWWPSRHGVRLPAAGAQEEYEMSRSLQRWGRFAARRPWVVIGGWLTISLLVLGGSAGFGQELEDTFSAPGVDSQKATELLARAGSDQRGVAAQIVVTPIDERATFHSSVTAREALAALQNAAEGLPHVLRDRGRRSVAGRSGRAHPGAVPGARTAERRGPREPQGARLRGRRGRLAVADRARWGSPVRLRGARDGSGGGTGPGRRDGHPAAGLRVGRGDGTPDRDGGLRHRPRRWLDVADNSTVRDPELGSGDRQHGRARRRDRLRALHRHPAPRVPRHRA